MAGRSYECPMCGYYGPLEDGKCPMCGHEIYRVVEVVKAPKPRRTSETYPTSAPVQTYSLPTPPPPMPSPRRSNDNRMEKKSTQSPKRRGGGALKLAAVVIILLLLLYFMPIWAPIVEHYLTKAKEAGEGLVARKYPSEVEFTMEKTDSFLVSGGEMSYDFHTPFPGNIPTDGSIQNIIDYSITPNPTSGTFTEWEFMSWKGSTSQGLSVSMRYHARVKAVTWDIDASEAGTVDMIPQNITERYVKNEWALLEVDTDGDGVADAPKDSNHDGIPDRYKIEMDNPDIVAKANEIVGGESNVYNILKKLYVYMTQDGGFQYLTGREGLPSRCVDTLHSKVGDCDDQSILFASLARSKGVPAWLVLGWLYDPKTGEWGGHGWLNAYIPMKDGNDMIVTIDIVNKEFLFRDPYRLTEWTDDGVNGYFDKMGVWHNGHLHYYYNSFTYTYTGHVMVNHDDDAKSIDFKEFGEVMYHDVGEGSGGSGGGGTRYAIPSMSGGEVIASIAVAAVVSIVYRRYGKKAGGRKRP